MSSAVCARALGAVCKAAIKAVIATAHDSRPCLLAPIIGASPYCYCRHGSRSLSGRRRLAAAAMSFTMNGYAIYGGASARPDLLVARDGSAGPAARERMGPQARRADRGAAVARRVPRLRLRLQWRPA